MTRRARDPDHLRASRAVRDLFASLEDSMSWPAATSASERHDTSATAAVLTDLLRELEYEDLAADVMEAVAMPRSDFWFIHVWPVIRTRMTDVVRELAAGAPLVQNPNRMGRGRARSHVDSPYHELLRRYGFRYVESQRFYRMPTGHGLNPFLHGAYEVEHTYERPDMGIIVEPGGWRGRAPSQTWYGAVRTVRRHGPDLASLERYLTGRARRRRRQR